MSPRGLITILLFFQITDEYICDLKWHHQAEGVLLFIILGSALTMSNALIGIKKIEEENLAKMEREKHINQENLEEIENNISTHNPEYFTELNSSKTQENEEDGGLDNDDNN